jgi:hypothetical protein
MSDKLQFVVVRRKGSVANVDDKLKFVGHFFVGQMEARLMIDTYKSEAEIAAVVEGFELCATPDSGFTHRAHLTVAVWYLSRGSVDQSLQQMRASIYRFLDHHHVGHEKYNETLTLFWIKLVRQRLDELDPKFSLLEATNALVESLGNSQIVFDYYTRERLWSEEARRAWVEPDLKALGAHPSVDVTKR